MPTIATTRHGDEGGVVGMGAILSHARPHLVDRARIAELADERGDRRHVAFGEGSDRDVRHVESLVRQAMTADDPWPDLAGRLVPGGHVLPVRVYFEDTDFSGVVYHGSYIRFMERGRSDFLRLLGVGHDALDRGERSMASRWPSPCAGITVDFLKPARIDDVLEVETRAGELARRPNRPGADGPARRRHAGHGRGDGGHDQRRRAGPAAAGRGARGARSGARTSLTLG